MDSRIKAFEVTLSSMQSKCVQAETRVAVNNFVAVINKEEQ
jgi:hypothetical protein